MRSLKRQKIDLMLVDDEHDILELSKMALNQGNRDLNIKTTTIPNKVLEQLETSNLDAIISDYNMPQMTGVDLLEKVREIDEDLPFILYTGEGTEEIAEEAINAGVTDYFKKEAGLDHYDFILNSLENSVEKYRDMERAEVLSVLVQNSNQPIVVTDTDANIVYVNEALQEISGYSESELIGENPRVLSSGEHEEEEFQRMYDALRDGESYSIIDMKNQSKEGEIYVHDQEILPINIHNGSPDYYAGISELKVD